MRQLRSRACAYRSGSGRLYSAIAYNFVIIAREACACDAAAEPCWSINQLASAVAAAAAAAAVVPGQAGADGVHRTAGLDRDGRRPGQATGDELVGPDRQSAGSLPCRHRSGLRGRDADGATESSATVTDHATSHSPLPLPLALRSICAPAPFRRQHQRLRVRRRPALRVLRELPGVGGTSDRGGSTSAGASGSPCRRPRSQSWRRGSPRSGWPSASAAVVGPPTSLPRLADDDAVGVARRGRRGARRRSGLRLLAAGEVIGPPRRRPAAGVTGRLTAG